MAKKTIFWQGWLADNPLTEDPNDFTLRVKLGNMATTEDIAKALLAEGTEFKLETLVDDGTKTPIEMCRLTVNNPSQLEFRVPRLEPGDYWLELATRYSKGQLTKEPRTARFEKVLNVLAADKPEGA